MCCNNTLSLESTVRKQFEETMVKKMNDPESYEFVEFIVVDSTIREEVITYAEKYIKQSMYSSSKLNSIEEEKLLSQSEAIDSIRAYYDKNPSEKNRPSTYTCKMTVRGKNAFGAKVLSDYYLLVDNSKSYDIIDIAEEKSDIKVQKRKIIPVRNIFSK